MKNYNKSKTVVKCGTFGCALGAMAVCVALCGTNHNAYAFVDTVTATLETSCSMAGNVTSAHTAAFPGAGSNPIDNIGNTNFTITCNDPNGWGIFAVGYSDDTEGNTDMISSVSDTYNIATGTGTSGPSSWAMKVTPGEGAESVNSFSSYHSVPTNYTKVVKKSSGTDAGSIVRASTTYRVYVAGNQPAGTYTSKVKYTLVNPSTKECPDGYELKDGTCQEKKLLMQDVAEWGSTLAVGDSVQAVDSRDDKTYWVTRLADGNIWMTQNLDLNITAAGLSSTDTDISTDWNSSSERPPVATLTDASQYSNSDNTTSTASWDAGDWYYDGTSSTSCGIKKTTYEGCTGFSSTGNAHYYVGNMYSWGAATAGTGGAITSGQATGSICPKGWRLPTGGSSGEFQALASASGGPGTSTVQN